MSRPRRLRAVWPGLAAGLSETKHLLIALDFDGTLAPLVDHPEKARLDKKIRSLLGKLIRLRNISVAIVSGRQLRWLKQVVGGLSVICVGLHGLEIKGPRLQFRHSALEKSRRLFRLIERRVRSVQARFPKLYLENKGGALALHVRKMTPAARRRLAGWLKRSFRDVRSRIHMTRGKMVVEILPKTVWNKGNAVNFIRQRVGATRVLMAGDDRTDEHMFHLARKNDVAVRIGAGKTRAAYILPRQADMRWVLSTLLNYAQGGSGAEES